MNLPKYYRLRNKNKVEGYAKELNGVTYFKGYNEFNWHTSALHFDIIDIGVPVFDKRNRRLYINDIVLYKVSSKPFMRKGLVAFDEKLQEFGIIDQQTLHFTPFFVENLCLFNNDRLEVVSHLFTNKEISR